MAYAQTLIEGPTGLIRPGEQVPDNLPGYDELVEGGAIGDEQPVVETPPASRVDKYPAGEEPVE